jgi:hypothetical protein
MRCNLASEMTAKQAVALLDADRQKRASAAAQAINALLVENNCELVAVPQLTQDGRIMATAQIVAK